jgi:hypothetical protein
VKFIAVDGEGHGDRLVLLAANSANNGVQTWVENYDGEGLSTQECVEFLWSLAECYPGDRFVGFSFTYDVNMILYPLLSKRKPMVRRLHEKKYVRVQLDKRTQLSIRFYTGKFVVFTEYVDDKVGRSIRIEDTFGFYQQSFVKALDKWEMSDTSALERIAEGKKHRSDSFADMDRFQVREYCLTECQQLAQLTDKLRHAIGSAGIELQKYIGAGAIAQTFMRKYNVHHHVRHDNEYGKEIQDAIMYAYFGGRSEIYRQGYFSSPTYVYDINSAYPTQTLTLPGLRNGEWRRYRGTDGALRSAILSDEIPYGLAYVSWDMHTPMPVLVPFPKRMPSGNIRYRSKGWGWYWLSETQAALRHFPDNVTIHEILAFDPRDTSQPFAFVKHLTDLRLQAKANNLPSNIVYKLGLNSLYGKTAQAKRGGRYPAYQSYVWAGMITAGTRAQLLDVIAPNVDNVIACATDGVIFQNDPGIPEGQGLGQWEKKSYDTLLYLQAGVYFANGRGINKTRGHILADLHYEQILEGWLNTGPNFEYSYTSRRFVGMGLANHLNDFDMWCDWIDFPRTLRCKPPGKIPETTLQYAYDDDPDHLWSFKHDKETYQLRCMPVAKREPTSSAMFQKFDIKPRNLMFDTIEDHLIAKEQPTIPSLF